MFAAVQASGVLIWRANMTIKQEESTQAIGNKTFIVVSHYGKQSPIDIIKNLLERESLKYTIHTNDKAS